MTQQIFLIIHIAAGTVALLAGGISAFAVKGGKTHIGLGRIFAVAMTATAVSALVLSVLNTSAFFLAIGLFTLYLVGSGWIWVRRIPLQRRTSIGRYIGLFGMGAAAYMLYVAFAKAGTVNIVLLVFAAVLLSMAAFDAFRKKVPEAPVVLHGGRMGGAYIAAFTAFIVVNIDFGIWGWLGPTVVGSPLIAYGLRRFQSTRQRSSAARKTVT